MALRLRAEYTNGLLKPLEPLELAEGTVVMVSIEEEESILDLFDRLRKSVPKGEWERLPADGAMNVKHYLYGGPKDNGQLTNSSPTRTTG